MLLIEKEFKVPRTDEPLIPYFRDRIDGVVGESDVPVRFAVTATDRNAYHCELGILAGAPDAATVQSIVTLDRTSFTRAQAMTFS